MRCWRLRLLRCCKARNEMLAAPAAALQINSARREELGALAVRKYLDALCVYFWAATSLLFT